MRVHVDWTRCDGHGSCAELLPELLTTDEWGFPLARGDQREPDVPGIPRASCPARRPLLPPAGAAARRLTQARRDSSTRNPLALASFSVG